MSESAALNGLKVSVLCSSPTHPVWRYLQEWGRYDELCTRVAQLSGGDVLFLVSCNELITQSVRDRYRKTLVLHASDLPNGRGWSPHIWQILEGRNSLTLSLLEADDPVDTGALWAKARIDLVGTELFDEINDKLFRAELRLMDWALDNFESVRPSKQDDGGSYYRKRVPADSRLDPDKSIAEQFNLLRVSDPERFPAFVEFRGQRFRVQIERMDPS